jgi:hypothetical protein
MKIETLKKIIRRELRLADVHPLREERILDWIDLFEEDNQNWFQRILRKKKLNRNEKPLDCTVPEKRL